MVFNKQKLILCGTSLLTAIAPLATNTTAVFAQEKTDKKDETTSKESKKDSKKDVKEDESSKTEKEAESQKEGTETKEKTKEDSSQSVDDKVQTLVQEEPNYVINLDENQETNIKQMLVDIANKTNIQAGEKVEVKQEEKKINSPGDVQSPIDILRQQTTKIQKDIESVETTKEAFTMEGLGKTEYKEFNTETKKDDTKTQQNYLYGNYLVSVKNYDETKVGDNQTAHVEFRPLSDVQKRLISVAQESTAENKQELLQDTIDSVTLEETEGTGDTDVIIRNKDVTAPDIQMSATSANIEQGEGFDINNYIQSVTDEGKTLNYTVTGDVDNTTPGTYNLTVSATDMDGNTSNQNFSVNVLDDYWQRIADAALAQVGVTQDCTMLATNALKAVGINFHGWPAEYAALGSWTNNPVPGDIIIYQGHVAIYIGNGQAVHGGWNGWTTVVSSVSCGNPLIGYIHPNRV